MTSMARYGEVWDSMVRYGTVWRGMARNRMEQDSMAWNGTVWHGMTSMAWYGTVWRGMGQYGAEQDGMGRYGLEWDSMGGHGAQRRAVSRCVVVCRGVSRQSGGAGRVLAVRGVSGACPRGGVSGGAGAGSAAMAAAELERLRMAGAGMAIAVLTSGGDAQGGAGRDGTERSGAGGHAAVPPRVSASPGPAGAAGTESAGPRGAQRGRGPRSSPGSGGVGGGGHDTPPSPVPPTGEGSLRPPGRVPAAPGAPSVGGHGPHGGTPTVEPPRWAPPPTRGQAAVSNTSGSGAVARLQLPPEHRVPPVSACVAHTHTHTHPHSRGHFEVIYRIRPPVGRGIPGHRPGSRLAFPGMNAAVRAVTRMGIYVGAKVFLIYEVGVPPCSPPQVGGKPPPLRRVTPHLRPPLLRRATRGWWRGETTSSKPTGSASPTSSSW